MEAHQLHIIQWNVGKRRESQLSLLNDMGTKDTDIILLQEPSSFTPRQQEDPVVATHHYWNSVIPTQLIEGTRSQRFRSMIYINKRLPYQQIPIESSDLTAVAIRRGTERFLCVSAYIPYQKNAEQCKRILRRSLAIISRTFKKAQLKNPELQLILGGDFNRHDPAWGKTSDNRMGEGEPLIQFIFEHNLWNALPHNTITFHNIGNSHQSTIDLILIPGDLRTAVQWCKTGEDHGSDHFTIHTAITLQAPRLEQAHRFKSYNNTDWEEVRKAVRERLTAPPVTNSKEILDKAAWYLEETVSQVLEELAPATTPFPYEKRWWTKQLTELRTTYHQCRNKWTRAVRNQDFNEQLRANAKRTRNEYLHAIQNQKKRHWKDFLDDSTNIWKALAYLNQAGKTQSIPGLRHQNEVIEEEKDKAVLFLDTFFPPQPIPVLEQQAVNQEARETLLSKAIERSEVYRAIFRPNPRKAPGPDELSFRVWQEVWPVVKDWIQALYQGSLTLGHLPATWTEAKIVVIQKPGKADYTVSKAYRPISLLRTISKGLESIVARRLSQYLEEEDLLPATQFGARPQRSTSQALTVITEQVYKAWRGGKVLSLASFDVKGAYNGVNKDVLRERLQEKGIPESLRSWIYSFCSNRRASVSFGNYSSTMERIEEPGLPQGSPLSPILYIVYNANLLQGKIEPRKGDVGFVDDYTAWVVGEDADSNTDKLQQNLIPRICNWEKESGATFEAEKTQFIHFGRYSTAKSQPWKPLWMTGKTIYPSEAVRILGVTLDQGLRMKAHIQQTTARAKQQAIALGTIKGLRPAAMRQLFTSTVTSKVDYAAPIWFKVQEKGGEASRLHKAIQKLGAQAILGAFKTAAGPLLEVEAGLKPPAERLKTKVRQYIIGLYTLPDKHPCYQFIHQNQNKVHTIRRFKSPITQALKEFWDILPHDGIKMETIHPFPRIPIEGAECITFHIGEDREIATIEANLAIQRHQNEVAIFTDGSARNGVTGAAFALTSQPPIWFSGYKTIAAQEDNNEYASELEAIRMALIYAQDWLLPRTTIRKVTIFSDCQGAIQSIQKPWHQSGQYIIERIIQRAVQLRSYGFQLRIQWAPGHNGAIGIEKAHEAARKATAKRVVVPPTEVRLKSRCLFFGRQLASETDQTIWRIKYGGKHTFNLDKALPQQHMAQVYNNLPFQEAKAVVQLRTGNISLNGFLHRIKAIEGAECECGHPEETPQHFLFTCPVWETYRQEMRKALGGRWGDFAYSVGAWSGRLDRETRKPVDGPREKWRPNQTVIRAVAQFVISTGRLQPKATEPEEEDRGEGEGEEGREE